MVWPAALTIFIYPPRRSVFVTLMTITTFFQASAGLSEARGTNIKYSKFWSANSPARKAQLPSRTGMLICYTPAFLAGVASFWLFPASAGLRSLLVRSTLTLHFLKRVLEVIFVHKYSGYMATNASCMISFSYFLTTVTSIYAHYLSLDLPKPAIDLTIPGLGLFTVGIAGNFYHHLMLSRLRADQPGDDTYKVPSGGLFGLVVCPHYLLEILGFIGISLVSQTVYSFASALTMATYLGGRSYATRRWYLSKFEDFPRHVKALVPFVF
ncbi:hypothetical protein SAY86_014285 [Trapa natans]|uniref:3-oxo-5-alpha-steroid 4-dehydrogenase C-terminal domain-containing protein n=1 Tax=Trapa natans TaxID=22666 RepID=A0AAN7KYV7_TRANT|nr:hypothetical protein SAY86_014285 [Trapa natans]